MWIPHSNTWHITAVENKIGKHRKKEKQRETKEERKMDSVDRALQLA